MKCDNCGSFNEEENSYCIECGHDLHLQSDNIDNTFSNPNDKKAYKNENNSKRDKEPINKNPNKSANYILVLTAVVLLIFFIRVFNSGLDLGQLYSDMNIGLLTLTVLFISLFACFWVYAIGIKLRLDTFENTEKYPMNDFFLKISKIYNLGMSRNIPEKVGFFEMSTFTLPNMFPVILLSAIATWNSVWGFPYKFIVELIFAIISIVIFISFLIFPDKINEFFNEDIRTENGFKKFFIISKIPLILMIIGVIVHLFF